MTSPHHRLPCLDALQYRVSSYSFCEFSTQSTAASLRSVTMSVAPNSRVRVCDEKALLARLSDFGIALQCIHGNGEVAVFEVISGKELVAVRELYQPLVQFPIPGAARDVPCF
jgi:hypothetical protein